MKIPSGLCLFIGSPGCGKTTTASAFIQQAHKKGIKSFSNVRVDNSYQIDVSDLGTYDISNCNVIIDEAGICFNNRKFKSLPQSTIEYAKLYRHYHVGSFILFSQGLDVDITFMRLADKIFIMKRCALLPFLTKIKRVRRIVGIDELSGQLIDKYEYVPLSTRFVYMPAQWKHFDSYAAPALPRKDFEFIKPYKPLSKNRGYLRIRPAHFPLKGAGR